MQFINLKPNSLETHELNKSFNKVLSSGNFVLGKEVKKFERGFAKFLEAKYCIGVGNGLEALQIALIALEIGKNDEVITTPVSAVATTLAILAVGAKPVFVDIDSNGLLDLNKIVITKKTRAILPVHLYGNPVDLKKLKKTCQKNKLFLIEDAAQAHGSKFDGKSLGTFGDLGCFSFYPTKNLGALGDGGAIITNNKSLAKICREIRDYGQKGKYRHIRVGLNSRLDELQAALLSVKLKYLGKENEKRRRLANRYTRNFSELKEIYLVEPDEKALPNYHLFVIKTNKRSKLEEYLKKFGIQTSIHYPKIIPDQPFLKKQYKNLVLPFAREFVKTCLSLPCHPKMSFEDVDFVSSKIIDFFKIHS